MLNKLLYLPLGIIAVAVTVIISFFEIFIIKFIAIYMIGHF